MPEYVRVCDLSTLHSYSVIRSAYEADRDAYKLLDSDAVDAAGRPLPPVYADEPETAETTTRGRVAGPNKES